MFDSEEVRRSSNSKCENAGQKVDREGGRQEDPAHRIEGGGYLDNCTDLKFSKNDFCEISDLRKMGLSGRWLAVAERIGVESFLEMWEELCYQVRESDDDRRVNVPCFSSYRRFQRDQVIKTRKAEGLSRKEIACYLNANLQTKVSLSTITRVTNG